MFIQIGSECFMYTIYIYYILICYIIILIVVFDIMLLAHTSTGLMLDVLPVFVSYNVPYILNPSVMSISTFAVTILYCF